MEFGRRPFNYLVFKSVRERLSAIQARCRTTRIDPEKLKTLRGLALIFLAVIFAWISLISSQSISINRYRSSHWPKSSVWKTLLRDFGFKSQSNLGEFSRQLQNHPDAFSDEPAIWISQNGCMIYVTQSPYQNRSSELWVCETKPKTPQAWAKIGSGTTGFENLVEFLEKLPKKVPTLRAAIVYKVDPKEIRY
jgi:hypothetical protein